MSSSHELLPSIERLIASAYAPSEPGAAFLLMRGGQTLYRGAVGLANLEHQIPVTPEMPFRLASLTKPFTACAILMLAEAGQLALSDPITRFLPEYPMGETPITLEHLLSHTSGVQNYTFLPEWWAVHRQDLGLPELLGLFQSKPSVSEPGARWAYNNSGYALLGAVIEKISGQSYGEFIEQHIFALLGMQHSWYGASASRVIPGLVSGYSKAGGEYVHPEYLSYTQVYAAGALISTLDDLAIWFAALRTGQLAPREMLEWAWQPYRLTDGVKVPYGFGWTLGFYQGHRLVEHLGLLPGFSNYLIALPDEDIFAVVLSNNDSKTEQPERLAFELAALALEQPYQAPLPVELALEQLQRCTGQYSSQDGEPLSVVLEAGGMFLINAQGQKLEIQPLSPQEFFFPGTPLARVVFVFGTDQQVAEMMWTKRQAIPLHARRTS